jgi:hypothetical protein
MSGEMTENFTVPPAVVSNGGVEVALNDVIVGIGVWVSPLVKLT